MATTKVRLSCSDCKQLCEVEIPNTNGKHVRFLIRCPCCGVLNDHKGQNAEGGKKADGSSSKDGSAAKRKARERPPHAVRFPRGIRADVARRACALFPNPW
eukprot:4349116-Prymnesium_polylepis.1